jgi:hypothetical protein
MEIRCPASSVASPPARGVSDSESMDPRLLVGGREADGKSISAERRLARIQKHDIVCHQGEQADKIAAMTASIQVACTSRIARSSDSISNLHCQVVRKGLK